MLESISFFSIQPYENRFNVFCNGMYPVEILFFFLYDVTAKD
jgi:hypothetical protein